MQNGDIVFFNRARTSSARKSPEITFKGHAFGMMLGHVPPFQKDPPQEHILRLVGTVGFISFDDVIAFLGDEAGAECVKKFEDKYYGKAVDPAQAVLPLDPEPSRIVDITGNPVSSHPPEDHL